MRHARFRVFYVTLVNSQMRRPEWLHWAHLQSLDTLLTRALSRGLQANARVSLRVRWPLLALAGSFVAQLVMPDPVWTTLGVTLVVLYGGALLWVRALARGVHIERTRTGSLIVVGDTLEEELVLVNDSSMPLVWAEFVDESDLPGYQIGRVAGAGARSRFKWRASGRCTQRGVFRLGPHSLAGGDPFRLCEFVIRFDRSEAVLIYPRVAHLPSFPLPRGYASGEANTRRPLLGALPAASVRPYAPQDPLRLVHWPSSARQISRHPGDASRSLMVREFEQEPSGDVWIVVDSQAEAQQAVGERNTLDVAVVAAASLAAQFLEGSAHRGVGIVVASGAMQGGIERVEAPAGDDALITVAPAAGSGHLWRILGALAPIRASGTALADILRDLRAVTGGRSSIVVITPNLADSERWIAPLVRLSDSGLAAGLVMIPTSDTVAAAEQVRSMLAPHPIPVQVLPVDAPLIPALTHRRRRTVLRTTPRGGTIAVEIEEEVA